MYGAIQPFSDICSLKVCGRGWKIDCDEIGGAGWKIDCSWKLLLCFYDIIWVERLIAAKIGKLTRLKVLDRLIFTIHM